MIRNAMIRTLSALVVLAALAVIACGLMAGQGQAAPANNAAPASSAASPASSATAKTTDKTNAKPDDLTGTLANLRARLAKITLTLGQTALGQGDLNDRALQGLREEVEAINRAATGMENDLAPRLATIKARLEQLGPEPEEGAPAESPEIATERKKQKSLHDSLDTLLKQERLLAIDVEDASRTIVARRRVLFAKAIFIHSPGLLAPELWFAALRELPDTVAATLTLGANLTTSLLRQSELVALGIMLSLWVAIITGCVWLSRWSQGFLARESQIAQPDSFTRIIQAFLTLFLTALPWIFGLSALSLSAHMAGLVEDAGVPLVRALVQAGTRVAFVVSMTRAVLAADRPLWRLVPIADHDICARLGWLSVVLAVLVSLGGVLDAFYDLLAASLSLQILTRGMLAVVAALLLVLTLRPILAGSADDDAPDQAAGPLPSDALPSSWRQGLQGAVWILGGLLLIAPLAGYVTFGTFLLGQIVWTVLIGAILYMLLHLIDAVMDAAVDPQSTIGAQLRRLTGFGRDGLEKIAVVLSAVLGIVLWALAALLVLAPWGIESDDLLGSLRSAFFGFRLGEVTISPSGIVLAMALFAMGLWATRSIQRWLDQRFLPLTSLDSGMRNSIRTSLGYAGYILALGVALAQIGLDIQKLAIVAGALSVGIGFGLQSIVNNFVSGLIILWERTIRVGDWIVVGDEQGYVRKINIRATEIETFDRAIMVVPNSTLVGGNVKNWVRGNKIGRIKIPLTLPLDSDPALVRATLLACAQEQELVLHEPAPQVILTGFAPGELKFELIVFVRDVESSLRARSEINFLILERFRAASIAMAPPPAVPTAVVNFHGLDKLEQVLTQAQVPAVSMPAPASIA